MYPSAMFSFFLKGLVTSIYTRLVLMSSYISPSQKKKTNMTLEPHRYHTNHIHMILDGKIQLHSLKCQKCMTSNPIVP